MSSFDDLLGGGDELPQRRGRGRPTNAEREARAAQALTEASHQAELRLAVTGRTKVSEEEFLLPVTKNFLGRVLRMDPMTIRRRLRACKPAASFGNNREVYYFHEALPYLVKPKMDVATYLRTLNPADMPNSVNKTFWEAEKIKNRVLIETGEAWHDTDVLEVFGTVFMMIKDRLPLITEGMRESGLTDAQSKMLATFCDQLQGDLYVALKEMPKQRRTLPRRASIDPGDGPESAIDDDDDGIEADE